jgi:hypothetical protein
MPKLIRINGKVEDCSKYGFPESWLNIDQGKPSQAAYNRAMAIIRNRVMLDEMARMEATAEGMDSGLRRNDEVSEVPA